MKSYRNIKWEIKKAAKKLLRISSEYEFIPARSIDQQQIFFTVNGKKFSLEADYTTPLYETIAEVVDYDCYQLTKLSQVSSKDQVVLDIGANIGVTAVVFTAFYECRILCFEPIAENCTLLRKNIERNHLFNIEIIQAAVAKQDGTLTFSQENDISVSAHIHDPSTFASQKASKLVEVKSISLKKIFQDLDGKSVALMKLDCEGGEYDIVDQIDERLANQIHAMTLEVHDLDTARNLKRIEGQLTRLGFTIDEKREMFDRRNLHHLLAVR